MTEKRIVNRRDFIKGAAIGAVGLTAASGRGVEGAEEPSESVKRIRIGMTEWDLQQRGKIESIKLAYEIGLDGVEISVGTGKVQDNLPNRAPERQEMYRDACYKYGIMIPSVCIGEIGSLPLNSEPKAALWVADTIEFTRNLGGKNILIPVLGNCNSDDDFKRLIDVLTELAHQAEDAGINLCLEAHWSAEDHLRVFKAVNHPNIKAYYDPRNAVGRGFDPMEVIPRLEGHIGQVHIKNGNYLLKDRDPKSPLNFPAIAKLLEKQKYEGWIILETRSPNDLIKDTRANIQYVREVFDIF